MFKKNYLKKLSIVLLITCVFAASSSNLVQAMIASEETTQKEAGDLEVENKKTPRQGTAKDAYNLENTGLSWEGEWPYNNLMNREFFPNGFNVSNRISKYTEGLGVNGVTTGKVDVIVYNDILSYEGEIVDSSKFYLTNLNFGNLGDATDFELYVKKSQSEPWVLHDSGAAGQKYFTFSEADGYLYSKVVYKNVTSVSDCYMQSFYKPTANQITAVNARAQNAMPATIALSSGLSVRDAATQQFLWATDGSSFQLDDAWYPSAYKESMIGTGNSSYENINTKDWRVVDGSEVMRTLRYLRVLDWLSVKNEPTNTTVWNAEKYQYDITASSVIYMPGGRQNLRVFDATYVMYLPKNIFLSEDFKVGDVIGSYQGGGTWKAASVKKELTRLNGEQRQKVTIGLDFEGAGWLGPNAYFNNIPLYTTDLETYKPKTTFSYPTRLVIGNLSTLDRNHVNSTGQWYQDTAGAALTPDGVKLVDNGVSDWVFAVNANGSIPEGVEITYDNNGGSGSVVDDNNPYIVDTNVNILGKGDMAKPYHTFTGWNTKADGSGTSYSAGDTFVIKGQTTLYAQWTIDKFKVIYDANGGTGSIVDTNSPYDALSDVTILENNKIVNEHYDFVEWNTEADGSGTSYNAGDTFVIKEDTTLYAQWKKKSYTITYHANGGVGEVEDLNAPYEALSDVTILGTDGLNYTHYEFVEWNTKPDGTGTSYNPDDVFTIKGNTDLYAQWKRIESTINVRYVDTDNNELSPQESFTGYAGDPFTLGIKNIKGYEYKSHSIDQPTSLRMGALSYQYEAYEQTITIVYDKIDTHASIDKNKTTEAPSTGLLENNTTMLLIGMLISGFILSMGLVRYKKKS